MSKKKFVASIYCEKSCWNLQVRFICLPGNWLPGLITNTDQFGGQVRDGSKAEYKARGALRRQQSGKPETRAQMQMLSIRPLRTLLHFLRPSTFKFLSSHFADSRVSPLLSFLPRIYIFTCSNLDCASHFHIVRTCIFFLHKTRRLRKICTFCSTCQRQVSFPRKVGTCKCSQYPLLPASFFKPIYSTFITFLVSLSSYSYSLSHGSRLVMQPLVHSLKSTCD